MNGVPLVPIQAITAVVLVAVSLVGQALYLRSHFKTALILAMVTTQLWRCFSETLRADYRGGGRLSAYQLMALAVAVYIIPVAMLLDVGDLTGC
jgi:hypothetical protein